MTANVAERPTIPVAGIPSDAEARCSASRGRRRPRHSAGAAQARPVHLAGVGRDSCRRDQAAQAAGDPDTGATYYRHWLNALERLVTEKGIADAGLLARYHDAWDHAADRTKHGDPIELRPEDFK